MVDLAVRWDRTAGRFDLVAADDGPDGLVTDGDIETAVLATLFTWGRARDDDPLPTFGRWRRGYWADAWPARPGMPVGTRAWTRFRSVLTDALAEDLRRILESDLQWLVDAGVARTVHVTATRGGRESPNRLDLGVRIVKPDGSALALHYENFWAELEATS